jgi:hypothetical protein
LGLTGETSVSRASLAGERESGHHAFEALWRFRRAAAVFSTLTQISSILALRAHPCCTTRAMVAHSFRSSR